MPKVVYLAGPLFTQGERDWNDRIAARIRMRGFRVLLPQERAKALIRPGEPLPVKKLFDDALAGVTEADVVIAVFDGPDPDSGTCFECGYAHAIGRPIIGVRTDLRLGGDDEEFSINLMLSHACLKYVRITASQMEKTAEQVADEIAEMLLST